MDANIWKVINEMTISFLLYCKQVTKIGRDSVLYVESLIESIMGGLEGLINILDSEGGFGALETQVIFYVILQQ